MIEPVNDTLKRATVLTALDDMIRRGSFNICTIDRCAEILGIQLKGLEAYKILSALHCIDYSRMAPEVRRALPGLIRECLQTGSFSWDVEPTEPPKSKPSMLQRFLMK